MAVFTETIQLVDQVSGPAKTAKSALESAGKTMGSLSKSTFDAANAMKVGKESIGAAITGIKDAFTSLAAGDVKGAVQGVTDSIAGMAKLLDLVVPGLGQAVAAVIQIAGGLVGVTAGLVVAGAKFAVSSSEAKNASIALFDAFGAGLISGERVDGMLDEMRKTTGLTKDSLAKFTVGFLKMGVTGEDALKSLTIAAASAESLVKGGGQAFVDMQEKIAAATASGEKLTIPFRKLTAQLSSVGLNATVVAKQMGISSEALTKGLEKGTIDAKKFGAAIEEAVKKKGSGPMALLASSASNLGDLFNEYLGDLFEDLGKSIAPFMAAMSSMISLLDSSEKSGTQAGYALKDGIGGFFKLVFANLTKVVPMVKHFFLDMIIFGLKAYLAIKPIAKAIKEFGESARGAAIIKTVLSSLWTVLKVIGVVLGVVVGFFVLLAAATTTVSVTVWTLVGALISMWTDGFMLGIATLSNVTTAITDFVTSAWGVLTGWVESASKAASDFVAGLVGGIMAGAGQVVGAVKGLADGAANAFKGALGIKSPSKVMAGFGEHMGGGVVQGLEASESDVHGASSGVAEASIKGMGAGASAAPSSGGGKGGSPITVNVTIDGAGKSAEQITQEMVASVFARMALEAGV